MKTKFIPLILTLGFALMSQVPSAHAGKLGLNPGSGELKAGCRNTVSIIINTEGADTNAADAFIMYNSDEIEILGIGEGKVYQAYPGKVIDDKKVWITAFNDSGSFNGRGVLATLAFKSKPGVTSTEIKFNYSPGSTHDSNIANLDATDVLNGAYNARYTFVPGACTSDRTPPWVEQNSPKPGDINVPLDSEIEVILKDNQSGLDIDSVIIYVNDIPYSKDGENPFKYTKRGQEYVITIKPTMPFGAREPVHVTVTGKDFDGNVMDDYQFAFNELLPIGQCPTETQFAAAPKPPGGVHVSFLILFLLSLAINIWQWIMTHPLTEPFSAKLNKIPKTKKRKKRK